MNSEEETFHKLKQTPFREVYDLAIHRTTHLTINEFREYLKPHYWTVEEFHGALYDSRPGYRAMYSNKEEFIRIVAESYRKPKNEIKWT